MTSEYSQKSDVESFAVSRPDRGWPKAAAPQEAALLMRSVSTYAHEQSEVGSVSAYVHEQSEVGSAIGRRLTPLGGAP